MSAAPSEPEKYSIDEMMDRLKNTASENPEEGELVTRSDGSQAIKVRKRKRRSSQPHKEEIHRTRRGRIFQVSAALVLVFASACAIGGAIIYANSSPFREALIRKIGEASGSTVDLRQFRMNPKTANAGTLTLNWPEGNALKSLFVRGLTAEVFPSSFLGKSLNGEEITVNYGSLALRIPQAGQPLVLSPLVDDTKLINFNRYRARSLDVTLGDPAAPLISLLKSEGSLTRRNVNDRAEFALYKGDLAINGWPNLRLDRARVEFRGQETDIIILRVLHEKDDRGSLEISGTISPYKLQESANLAVSLESFDMSGVTGPQMGRIFSGRIDSRPVAKSNYLSFMPNGGTPAKLDIAFQATPSSRIELQNLPFLNSLSQILDYPWFDHPVFDAESSGVIHRESDVITLRELDFSSKGHMAVRGEISIKADQTLSGNLRIGVTDSIISASRNARLKSVFGPPNEGFCWITLKVSGPAASPADNFKEIYNSSAATSRETPAPGGNSGSSFEELTRPR